MESQSVHAQILTFKAALDLMHFVERRIELHKSKLEHYEEELGLMLRQQEQGKVNTDLAREMKEKMTAAEKKPEQNKGKMKERKERRPKQKAKGGKNWTSYRDIQLFSGNVNEGKTEIYFQAINELKMHIEQLARIKQAFSQLAGAGVSNVYYVVYVKDGVPLKLLLIPQESQGVTKFEFKADFVSENSEVPLEAV
jgi:hypothetical protein